MFQRRSSAPKTALRGDDPDVGEQRVLEPGGDRPAVDGRDHRLEHVDAPGVAAVAGGVVDVGAELVPFRPRPVGGVLEVPAGAERLARAGDHEHERLVVVAKPPPGVVELVVHPPRDRVALLGPVVGEDGDVVVDLVGDLLVIHPSS